MNGPDTVLHRQLLTAELLRRPCTRAAALDPNRQLLASLLAGQALGRGCLNRWLGMSSASWQQMIDAYFQGYRYPGWPSAAPSIPEWSDLQKLLLDHRAGVRDSELWMADILASACAGDIHLWQDLGLTSRDELTQLMQCNFPALADANSGDMKWKKFLYRQFCARDGIYVCPAPSCGVCSDYTKCYSPEN